MAVPNRNNPKINDAYFVFGCLFRMFGYRRRSGELQVKEDGSETAGVKPGIYQRRWNGYNNHSAKPKNQRKMYYMRMKYYRPTNPQTSKQQANRAKIARAVSAWHSLSASDRETWRELAKKNNRRGYNYFISEYLKNLPPETGQFPYELSFDLGS